MRSTVFAKLLLVLGLGAVALPLTACNTVEGAGQDVQAVGHGIENSADSVKREIHEP